MTGIAVACRLSLALLRFGTRGRVASMPECAGPERAGPERAGKVTEPVISSHGQIGIVPTK